MIPAQELGCSLGALMLGLAEYESILLFQRAALIDLISSVFVFSIGRLVVLIIQVFD